MTVSQEIEICMLISIANLAQIYSSWVGAKELRMAIKA